MKGAQRGLESRDKKKTGGAAAAQVGSSSGITELGIARNLVTQAEQMMHWKKRRRQEAAS